MKSEKNEVMFDYEHEESAAMYIPACLTIGMLVGLVVGELFFSSMSGGMFIGMAVGAASGIVSALAEHRRSRH
jgi:uncharacterized membrane protein